MEFHEKLQELRKSRGLTQEELQKNYMCRELLYQSGSREEDIQVLIH